MELSQTITNIFSPNDESVYRYEKKFVATDQSLCEIEWVVKQNPFLFRSIFHQRQVNNIYFDSPEFQDFYDNVDGNSKRGKLRLRWYGNLFGDVGKPVMEAKIKSGDLGTKRTLRTEPFCMQERFEPAILEDLLEKLPASASKPFLEGFRPTLVNSYVRRYYLSADQRFRITVDHSLKYYKIGLSKVAVLTPLTDRRKTIIELKYDQAHSDAAREVTRFLPFRVTKNSKYVSGIRKTFYHLAENDDLGDVF